MNNKKFRLFLAFMLLTICQSFCSIVMHDKAILQSRQDEFREILHSIEKNKVHPQQNEIIERCHDLTEFKHDGMHDGFKITDKSLHLFEKLNNLQSLSLPHNNIHVDGAKALSQLRGLQLLDVSYNPINQFTGGKSLLTNRYFLSSVLAVTYFSYKIQNPQDWFMPWMVGDISQEMKIFNFIHLSIPFFALYNIFSYFTQDLGTRALAKGECSKELRLKGTNTGYFGLKMLAKNRNIQHNLNKLDSFQNYNCSDLDIFVVKFVITKEILALSSVISCVDLLGLLFTFCTPQEAEKVAGWRIGEKEFKFEECQRAKKEGSTEYMTNCAGTLFDLSDVKHFMIAQLKDVKTTAKINITKLLPIPSTEFSICVLNEGNSLALQYIYHFLDQYPLMAGHLAFYVTAFSLFTNVMIGVFFQHIMGLFI